MIDLPEKAIKAITENLVLQDNDSQRLVLQAIRNEERKGTFNSNAWVDLDNRYNGLLPIATDYNLIPILIKRGCQIIILYNPSSNQIYLFLKRKTLRAQFKKGKATYYVKLLNLFNEEFDSLMPLEEQLNLFSEDASFENYEDLRELGRKVLRNLQKDPSSVFVFTYDNQRLLPQVEAIAFNTKQEVVRRTDYSYLLDSNYEVDVQSDGIDSGTKESGIIPMKKPQEKKQIVRLKSI